VYSRRILQPNISKQITMKITIELEGLKCTIENEESYSIHDAMELMIQAFSGIGFSEAVITKGLDEITWP